MPEVRTLRIGVSDNRPVSGLPHVLSPEAHLTQNALCVRSVALIQGMTYTRVADVLVQVGLVKAAAEPKSVDARLLKFLEHRSHIKHGNHYVLDLAAVPDYQLFVDLEKRTYHITVSTRVFDGPDGHYTAPTQKLPENEGEALVLLNRILVEFGKFENYVADACAQINTILDKYTTDAASFLAKYNINLRGVADVDPEGNDSLYLLVATKP